jgi:hypothetical protein
VSIVNISLPITNFRLACIIAVENFGLAGNYFNCYSESEVETDAATLQLETSVTALKLGTDEAALELETFVTALELETSMTTLELETDEAALKPETCAAPLDLETETDVPQEISK